MLPEAQLSIHECAQFSADSKLPHNQYIKPVINYLKVMATQVLILKSDTEK